jgi:LexA-binding, inner membrane-associated putative hydrolase
MGCAHFCDTGRCCIRHELLQCLLMPSPVGHALAGVAAAWLTGGRLPRQSQEVILFSAAAIAPDLDLLFGTHSTYTHSIGAVLIVFALTMAAAGVRQWRIAVGVAAAWGSHILLDWFGTDTSPPIGIMALWPFDSGHYQSSLSIFDAISRRYWLPDQFVWGNLRAALKEIVILAPLAAGAYVLRRRS